MEEPSPAKSPTKISDSDADMGTPVDAKKARRLKMQAKKEEEERIKQEEINALRKKMQERHAKAVERKKKKEEEVRRKKKEQQEKVKAKKKAVQEKKRIRLKEKKMKIKQVKKEREKKKKEEKRKKQKLEKELEHRMKLARQMLELEKKEGRRGSLDRADGSGTVTPGDSALDALRLELMREADLDNKRLDEERAAKAAMDQKLLARIQKEHEERLIRQHAQREAKVRKALMDKRLNKLQREVDKASREHKKFQEIVKSTQQALAAAQERSDKIKSDIEKGVPASVTVSTAPKGRGGGKEGKAAKLGPRPTSVRSLELKDELVGDTLFVWDFLRAFHRPLSLSPFPVDEFIKALEEEDTDTVMVAEACMALLRFLLDDVRVQEGVTAQQKAKKTRREDDPQFNAFSPNPSPQAINALTWGAAIRVVLMGSSFYKDMEEAEALPPLLKDAFSRLETSNPFRELPMDCKLAVLRFACDAVYGAERMTSILQDNMTKKLEILSRQRADDIEYRKKMREQQQKLRAEAIERLNKQKEEDWHKRKQEAKKQQEAMKAWLTQPKVEKKGDEQDGNSKQDDSKTEENEKKMTKQDSPKQGEPKSKEKKPDDDQNEGEGEKQVLLSAKKNGGKAPPGEPMPENKDDSKESDKKEEKNKSKSEEKSEGSPPKNKKSKGKKQKGNKNAEKKEEEFGDEPPAFTHNSVEVNQMIEHLRELQACGSEGGVEVHFKQHAEISPEVVKMEEVKEEEPKSKEELSAMTRTAKNAYLKRQKRLAWEKQNKERAYNKKLEQKEELDDARNTLIKCFKKHDLYELDDALAYGQKVGLEGTNEDGSRWMTFEMKKGYGVLEMLREKQKRAKQVEKFQKEIDDCLIRTECLGEDSSGKKYWLFANDVRLFIEETKTPSFNLEEEDIDNWLDSFQDVSWTYFDLMSQILALIRSLDRTDLREKKLREALMERWNISEKEADDWVEWRTEGNEYIGRRVRRLFKVGNRNNFVHGIITGWLSAAENEGLELWHVNHEDGDEEDLDQKELHEAIKAMEEEEEKSKQPVTEMEVDEKPKEEPKRPSSPKRRSGRAAAQAAKKAISATEAVDSSKEKDPKADQLPKHRRYVNNLNKDGPRDEDDFGLEALRHQFCSVEGQMRQKLQDLDCPWVSRRNNGRMAWLKVVKDENSGVKELSEALIELEDVIHGLQEAEDVVGDEEKHIKLEDNGWLFEKKSHKWIGRRVRRFFNKEPTDGTITAYLPTKAKDDIELWHVEHDDEDEEDLGDKEVKKAMAAFDDDLGAEAEEDSDSDDDGGSEAGDKEEEEESEEEEEEESEEEEEEESTFGSGKTLWPTWGYRHGWIKAVQECEAISVLALALNSLLDVSVEFGAAEDFSTQRKTRRANKWQKAKKHPKKKTKARPRKR